MLLLLQLDALNRGAVSLNGELTLSDLDMVSLDDLVEPAGPLNIGSTCFCFVTDAIVALNCKFMNCAVFVLP